MALQHIWHLSRKQLGRCQLGHEELIWVLRVMEICVGNVFPREFWAACGYWECVDLQGLYEGRPGAAHPEPGRPDLMSHLPEGLSNGPWGL